jgi:hypothetical protein
LLSVEATVEHLQCSYAPHWRLCQTDAPCHAGRRAPGPVAAWCAQWWCALSVSSKSPGGSESQPHVHRRPCWLQVARGRGHWRCAHCGSLTASSTGRPRTRPFKLTARPRGPSRGSSSLRGHGGWPVRCSPLRTTAAANRTGPAPCVLFRPQACAADADPQ